MWRPLASALVLVSSACGNVASTPDAPIVPADVAIDAPTECPIGTTALCSGSDLVTCDGQGNITDTTPCDLGCDAAAPRCLKVDPSNGLAMFLDDAATGTDLILSGSAVIDTDAGTVTDQSGARSPLTSTVTTGVQIGVFVIKVKAFTTGGDVTVQGTRALAIVAADAVTIDHNVSVSARNEASGPGALTNDGNCKGGTPGTGNAEGRAGGGGGGFGTAGGRGGNGGNPAVQGGSAGQASGTVELMPLRGGCPGGVSNPAVTGHIAGGAGGAIQIVSAASIAISATGSISANGAGGNGPVGPLFCIADTPCGVGIGGGSGGAVLLEAPSVTVNGGIFANGGAGKCSAYGSAQDGQNSATKAAGETCGGQTGNGGDGAAAGIGATNGADRSGDNAVGGGGGGGAGRIRVNLPAGMSFTATGTVSPSATAGALGTR